MPASGTCRWCATARSWAWCRAGISRASSTPVTRTSAIFGSTCAELRDEHHRLEAAGIDVHQGLCVTTSPKCLQWQLRVDDDLVSVSFAPKGKHMIFMNWPIPAVVGAIVLATCALSFAQSDDEAFRKCF